MFRSYAGTHNVKAFLFKGNMPQKTTEPSLIAASNKEQSHLFSNMVIRDEMVHTITEFNSNGRLIKENTQC